MQISVIRKDHKMDKIIFTLKHGTTVSNEFIKKILVEKNVENSSAVLVFLDLTAIQHVPITPMEKDACLNVIVKEKHIIDIMFVVAYPNLS